jgi:hypothetical protein
MPEVFSLCLIAQDGNVPLHGPFLAVNVAGASQSLSSTEIRLS